jgi:hypothetical protein
MPIGLSTAAEQPDGPPVDGYLAVPHRSVRIELERGLGGRERNGKLCRARSNPASKISRRRAAARWRRNRGRIVSHGARENGNSLAAFRDDKDVAA